jgi:hypothetical protein
VVKRFWAAAVLALVFPVGASAGVRVIYGINDGNFGSHWAMMKPEIEPLGPIQVAGWLYWDCRNPSYPVWEIPESQPSLLVATAPANLGSCAPHTSSERRAFCQFLSAFVDQHPGIREVQVWNEPDLSFWQGSDRDYVALLARCYDALHSRVVVLGAGFSPHAFADRKPRTLRRFARDVRWFYRRSHRAFPLMDGLALHTYWGFGRKTMTRAARVLNSCWRLLPQASPNRGLRFWWTETGTESQPPPPELSGYFGTANGWNKLQMLGSPEAQAMRVAAVARAAKANPLVVADFSFKLRDDRDLSRWQSGLYYADGIPKPAFFAFQESIR